MSRSLAIASLVVAALLGVATAETRPKYGGTLRIETRADWANSGNPARTLVLETLTTIAENGSVQPKLATSWEPQADSRRWQFTIRKNVKFHDGSPLNPTNIVDALTVNDCDGCPWRSIRAQSDSVTFEFSEPYPNFPAELASPRFAVALARAQDTGTGPFKVSDSRQDGVLLSAYEDYWQGRPFLDSVEVTTGRSERDQAMDMEVGRADVVEAGPVQMRRLQNQKARFTTSRPVELLALRIRTLRPELEDARLREAIALTIDRSSIHTGIFQGQGEMTASLLPNWLTGYGFLFPPQRNLTRAQELIRALGQAPSVTVSAEPDPLLQLVAERIALNLRDAGVTAKIAATPDRADLVVRRTTLTSGDAGAAVREIVSGFNIEPQPSADSPQRVYEQQRAILEEHLVVPLAFLPRTWVVSARLRNWIPGMTGWLRIEEAWVAESPRP